MRLITNPDGARVILLSVSQGDEAALDGYDVAIVEPTVTAEALKRIAAFAVLKAADSDLESMRWWSYAAEYFPADEYEPVGDDQTPPPIWNRDTDSDSRTEMDRMVVDEREVYWTAYAKHTDVRLRTEPLSLADLQAIEARERAL